MARIKYIVDVDTNVQRALKFQRCSEFAKTWQSLENKSSEKININNENESRTCKYFKRRGQRVSAPIEKKRLIVLNYSSDTA